MREEVSPFLRRDYRHVEQYRPAYNAREQRDRADRLKAKMLCERLLHKKWDRTGELHWRVIQRVGNHGRRYGIWYVLAVYWLMYAIRGW